MKRFLSLGILSAAIVGVGALSASAAPFTPPSGPTETANQAEQVQHRSHSNRRRSHHRYSHRGRHHHHHHHHRGPRVYYGPGFHGGYYRDYESRGPYVYGGIGLPFIGLSIGGGHRHHRHW